MMLVLVLVAHLCLAAHALGPIVRAPAGPLQGDSIDGVDRFAGVPFAQAPVGPLRWKSPLEHAPWTAVREARAYGDDCLAASDYIVVQNKSEDCLYLNVFRPANAPAGAALPVMHFFYGGSWEQGGSSFPIYDGGSLVLKGNVIVVTSNC
jgi:carboxylesterase type B